MARTVIVVSLKPITPLSERVLVSLLSLQSTVQRRFRCRRIHSSTACRGAQAAHTVPHHEGMMDEIALRRKRRDQPLFDTSGDDASAA
jgi:hypothetical protein